MSFAKMTLGHVSNKLKLKERNEENIIGTFNNGGDGIWWRF